MKREKCRLLLRHADQYVTCDTFAITEYSANFLCHSYCWQTQSDERKLCPRNGNRKVLFIYEHVCPIYRNWLDARWNSGNSIALDGVHNHFFIITLAYFFQVKIFVQLFSKT
jgi:hypothetical protein